MKVALCLMGVVGSAEFKYGAGKPIDPRIGHYFYKKHLLNHNNTDIFIHSWSTEFKNLLLDLYKPKKHLIEKQINFNQNNIRSNSIASRWYSTATSIALKTLYEKENNIEYDFVIIARFDCMFNKDLIFSQFNKNNFYISHVNECYNELCKCNIGDMYSDLWAFGNSKDINTFGSLYEQWGEYGINNPHKELKHHIQKTGLQQKLKHVFYERYDHYPIRTQFINCHYNPSIDLNINNLKTFKWGEGYTKRTKK